MQPPVKHVIILDNATVFKTLASYRWFTSVQPHSLSELSTVHLFVWQSVAPPVRPRWASVRSSVRTTVVASVTATSANRATTASTSLVSRLLTIVTRGKRRRAVTTIFTAQTVTRNTTRTIIHDHYVYFHSGAYIKDAINTTTELNWWQNIATTHQGHQLCRGNIATTVLWREGNVATVQPSLG